MAIWEMIGIALVVVIAIASFCSDVDPGGY